jgi:arginase family enzyme
LTPATSAISTGRAAEGLSRGGGAFWIHLDVDVLDEEAMPATDY